MSLSAQKIHTKKKRLFIPVTAFAGWEQGAFTQSPTFTVTKGAIGSNLELGLSADDAAGTVNNNTIASTLALTTNTPVEDISISATSLVQSSGNGNPLFKSVAGGVVGLRTNTAGDDISHFMAIPWDWSREHQVKVRSIFSTESTTAADTITWKFLYLPITLGTTALVAPSTALDTAIAQDTVAGTADVIQASPWGIINANTIATTVDYISFLIEMDAKAGGLSENIHLHGVEFEYSPHWSPQYYEGTFQPEAAPYVAR